jgi:shikimate dehydrogenase
MSDLGKIIATVYVESPTAAADEIRRSIAEGADRAEVRIDAFKDPLEAAGLIKLDSEYPLLFSGNRYKTPENEMNFFKTASKRGAWVDIPYVENFKLPEEIDASRTIISCHGELKNFAEMEKLALELKGRSALIKIVPPCKSILDAAAFLHWVQKLKDDYPIIAFPTGAESAAARIIALAFGSKAVYAASPGSLKTAEGQLGLDALLRYRPKEITAKTSLYGLLGYPLDFSMSPSIWNGWFAELRMDARFLPFPSSNLDNALKAFAMTGVRGFGVTAPYKEAIKPFLDSMSNVSKRCGAVNTVKAADGRLCGANTDAFGIRRSLSFLEKKRRILILGGGGAARAAILALRVNHNVAVSARSKERGAALSGELGAGLVDWETKHRFDYDVIVNATTAGSDGKSMPWEENEPLRTSCLMEMIAGENPTPLERKAKAEGLTVIGGDVMLYYQAFLQFRILTGRKPPRAECFS